MLVKSACLALLAAALGGCASYAPRPGGFNGDWGADAARRGVTWGHHVFPGKRPSDFEVVHKEGREAVSATSAAAASMLRKKLRVEPHDLGQVRFSWMVSELIAQADLAARDADDSPARIILAFEGDRSRFSARDAMLSELALTLTGEEMPYATLMYVWCNQRATGTVVPSPRTTRIRSVVLESGTQRLNRWIDYERDIRADYERAFGEAPGALIGVAIMTDSDNTRATARAWYGPVRLVEAGQGR